MNRSIQVRDKRGVEVPSQLIDINSDGIADQLLIWVSYPVTDHSSKYELSFTEKELLKKIEKQTYCRFVPERMDDFAWENDKVAFRTYGPKCEELAKQNNPNGLISSGIDCWLKRVDYPIIDKWYKKELTGGSYHRDDGEGLDNFHVGVSRGCGGTAIRNNGKFVYSGNFSEWQVLTNGPLRSVFKLKYKPVMVDGKSVVETKTITIERGDNFYRCDVEFESEKSLDTLAIGLTLHENKGRTNYSSDGWISYWQPIYDSEIGMGVWVDKNRMLDYYNVDNEENDMNHIWLFVSLKENKCTYYSGFGWKKAGDFVFEKEWLKYIREQSTRLNTISQD